MRQLVCRACSIRDQADVVLEELVRQPTRYSRQGLNCRMKTMPSSNLDP